MKRQIAAVALLFSQATCSDLTLVSPKGNVAPVLSIYVSVDQQQSSEFQVSAELRPGTDSAGQPSIITDSVLFVNGHAILPMRPKNAPSYLLYAWKELRPGRRAQFDSLELRVPSMAGRSALGPLFVALPARGDSADVVVPDSADLVLRLSQSAEPSVGFAGIGASWTLRLTDACTSSARSLLQILGDGAPPAEIRVPQPWLSGTRPDPLAACLGSNSSYVRQHDGYTISLILGFQASWRIHKA